MATDEQHLLLDPAIRDWVLIPIMIVMVLVGVLRHFVTLLITGEPKKPPLKAVRESKALLRGMQLRQFANHVPPHAFESRKAFLSNAYESGVYLKNPDAGKQNVANPMASPEAMESMMEGMKKQVSNMVPQMIIMAWINFFFQGFVLIKLPFPLTLRFKSMLQRGVETSDMDVTWVSSLSWYFLNLFGLGSVFRLILGDDNAAGGMNDVTAMGGMVPGGMPGMGGQGGLPDFAKLFAAEKENLALTRHEWDLQDIAKRVLEKYGKTAPEEVKLPKASGATLPPRVKAKRGKRM